ncbi:PREDICTED: calmodulin-binding protein 25-like [Camelina sativa]|uniref:Calmodulin-binding protein 25-like n=1 Tax=Camelina sativa TaxID=90675 RepID=A0ABM0TK10_CAMSA|nr:PREDICTED: calmodulin-binding protein 25-like [Camelina sativa]
MASSEGLASVEPWSFRQSFNIDSWLISDSFSHDSDIIAKALHRSISTSTDSPLSPSSFFDSSNAVVVSDLSPPQTLSNVSFGSDPELPGGGAGGVGGGKRKRGPGVSGGKQTKRRARVSSKKSQTTFITADAANFRQMVQQVTGAKFIGGCSPNGIFAPLVKPEPHRLSSRLPPSCGSFDRSSSAVPTLDTSSFLSNHQQENIATDLGSVSAQIGSFHHQSSAATTTATPGNVGGGSAVELDSYPSFPTLESWTVM